jgi:hypothetical protein
MQDFPSNEHALTAASSDQGGYTQIHLRPISDLPVIRHTVKRRGRALISGALCSDLAEDRMTLFMKPAKELVKFTDIR